LNLLNNNEARAATSPSKQALFESLHIHIIRLSIPPKASTQAVTRTAQYIRGVGATPLVSLQGRLDNDALANDTQVVKVMNQVFGRATVYYEYGNEDDAQGVSAENYTTSWNTVVPRLKQITGHGQFVGPVTYHYDHSYLQTFLLRANPQPDEVSWHEYTCDNPESKEQCLSQIGAWNQHITEARTVMRTVVGKELPIMISEWNYSESPSADDGKSNDNTFMTQWTSQALQTLAKNKVFASMQFSGANTSMPLINNDDTLTAQGATLQSVYEHLMSDPKNTNTNTADTTASPASDTLPSPTATTADSQSNNVTVTPTASGDTTGSSGATVAPVTPTPVHRKATPILPTATPVPPTAAPIPPTVAPIPPTVAPIPPTAAPILPTATPVPPTPTPVPPPTATPVPPPPPPPHVCSKPTLRSGSKGSNVKYLQGLLNKYVSPALVVDGDFGPLTQQAVRKFQTARHLLIDGIVGPQTWGALGCTS
jgi:hypothetical protein